MASTSVAAGGDAPENRLLIPGEKGVHSGIPEAVFLEDIDSFMKGETAEDVLKRLDEQHQKFKFMLSNFDNKKKRLKGQIPDITTTLESVKVCKLVIVGLSFWYCTCIPVFVRLFFYVLFFLEY